MSAPFLGMVRSPPNNTGNVFEVVVSVKVRCVGCMAKADTGESPRSDENGNEKCYGPTTTVGLGPDVETTTKVVFIKNDTGETVHPSLVSVMFNFMAVYPITEYDGTAEESDGTRRTVGNMLAT